jgi:hypothetical protein
LLLFILFFAALGIELRALSLTLSPFCSDYFRNRAWTPSSYFKFPAIAGMTGTALFCWDGAPGIFPSEVSLELQSSESQPPKYLFRVKAPGLKLNVESRIWGERGILESTIEEDFAQDEVLGIRDLGGWLQGRAIKYQGLPRLNMVWRWPQANLGKNGDWQNCSTSSQDGALN